MPQLPDDTANQLKLLRGQGSDLGLGVVAGPGYMTADSAATGSGVIWGISSALEVSVTLTQSRLLKITIQAAYFVLGGSGNVTSEFVVYDNTSAVAIDSIIVANSLNVGQNVPGSGVVAFHAPGVGTTQYIAALLNTAHSGSPTVVVGATAVTYSPRRASITVEDVGPA